MRQVQRKVVAWACIALLALSAFPRTSGAGGGGRPAVELVFDRANAYGHLHVVRQVWPGSGRVAVTATFTAATGEVVLSCYDSQAREAATFFPGGVVSMRTVAGNRRLLTVAQTSGEQAAILLDLDGRPLSSSDGGVLNRAVAGILAQSADALAAFKGFAMEEGLGGTSALGGTVRAQDAETVFCAAAVASLAASYVGLAACAFTFGLGCVAALVGHTASVVGLGSCF